MALSQLNPQIIGAEMVHGFAGSYARLPDMIVVTRPVGEKEPLPFGMARAAFHSGVARICRTRSNPPPMTAF